MTRTVYLVETDGGFLGTRAFSYTRGSHSNPGRPFDKARVFLRKSDAMQAMNLAKEAKRVVEATLTLET